MNAFRSACPSLRPPTDAPVRPATDAATRSLVSPAGLGSLDPGEPGPGCFLGSYEVLAPIGAGGMARVWVARRRGCRGFSKTFAIKTLRRELARDPYHVRMFLDEARISSRIQHPNAVEILDLGENNGILYMVMELVEGESLSLLRRLAGGHLPWRVVTRICADAAAGLHAAHEARDEDGSALGIVHRDVSPHNILVTLGGIGKIADFGVVKAQRRNSGETHAGVLKGKPGYMAPEQALGHPLDPRCDVFSMGVVLYVLTTGHHPFRRATDLETLRALAARPTLTPPSALVAGLPPAFDSVVMRALEYDRDRRFPTARDLASDLDHLCRPAVTAVEVAQYLEHLSGDRARRRQQALRERLLRAEPTGTVPSAGSRVATLASRLPRPTATLPAVPPLPRHAAPGLTSFLVALACCGAGLAAAAATPWFHRPPAAHPALVRLPLPPDPSEPVALDPATSSARPQLPLEPSPPERRPAPPATGRRGVPRVPVAGPVRPGHSAPAPSARPDPERSPRPPVSDPGF